jgi:hypothetical protein
VPVEHGIVWHESFVDADDPCHLIQRSSFHYAIALQPRRLKDLKKHNFIPHFSLFFKQITLVQRQLPTHKQISTSKNRLLIIHQRRGRLASVGLETLYLQLKVSYLSACFTQLCVQSFVLLLQRSSSRRSGSNNRGGDFPVLNKK